jgi:hypothetical protein
VLQFSDPKFSSKLIKTIAATLGLSTNSRPWLNKMTKGLQEAYNSAKLDGDIIDRIKHVKANKSLKVKECSAARLGALFGVPPAEMEEHLTALITKSYLKRIRNKLSGDYYSLTPKTERLLL